MGHSYNVRNLATIVDLKTIGHHNINTGATPLLKTIVK